MATIPKKPLRGGMHDNVAISPSVKDSSAEKNDAGPTGEAGKILNVTDQKKAANYGK